MTWIESLTVAVALVSLLVAGTVFVLVWLFAWGRIVNAEPSLPWYDIFFTGVVLPIAVDVLIVTVYFKFMGVPA